MSGFSAIHTLIVSLSFISLSLSQFSLSRLELSVRFSWMLSVLCCVQVYFPGIQPWIWFLSFATVCFILRLEWGVSSSVPFYLSFVNSMVDTNRGLDHLREFIWSFYMCNLVFDMVLESGVEYCVQGSIVLLDSKWDLLEFRSIFCSGSSLSEHLNLSFCCSFFVDFCINLLDFFFEAYIASEDCYY